jgi:prepilin-type N-terminal cleavage/methylation domain-containing protein
MTDDGKQRTPLCPKGYSHSRKGRLPEGMAKPITAAGQAEDGKRLTVLCPQSSIFRLRAFTLAESMVVVVIVSLLILIAATNLKGVIIKNSFKAKSQGLVAALEAASTSAGQSDKRYEVIIDIPQQSYLFREISSSNLADVLEEEIIAEEDFGANCTVSYVLFDDGQFTNEDRAKFRASRAGWQFGGIIVLLDSEGQPWSIIIDRLSNIVRVQPGEAQIVWPRSKDDLPF